MTNGMVCQMTQRSITSMASYIIKRDGLSDIDAVDQNQTQPLQKNNENSEEYNAAECNDASSTEEKKFTVPIIATEFDLQQDKVSANISLHKICENMGFL